MRSILYTIVNVFQIPLPFYATQILTRFLIQGSQKSLKRVGILTNLEILILLNVPVV